MDFRLPWSGAKGPASAPIDDASKDRLGLAVQGMVDARLGILKATLAGRAALMRAKAELCDSKAEKEELGFRASELEYVIGEMGKG